MSTTFGPAEAQAYTHKLLTVMQQQGGSDLFISADFPPSMKHQGAMKPLSSQRLTGEVTRALALSLMNERQRAEFEAEMECNFAISLPNVCRFRVNVFVQQQSVGMVVRTIASEIPTFEKLDLPDVLKDVVMTKRGLVLVVGGTGSGKSTTLATPGTTPSRTRCARRRT
jgi:twitching motility protein PilU